MELALNLHLIFCCFYLGGGFSTRSRSTKYDSSEGIKFQYEDSVMQFGDALDSEDSEDDSDEDQDNGDEGAQGQGEGIICRNLQLVKSKEIVFPFVSTVVLACIMAHLIRNI